MPAERPKLRALSSVYSAGIQRAPPSPRRSVMEAHLCGWSAEERRSQPGVQKRGQSPAVFFSLPFALSCANAYLRLMIFRFSFPMLWSPSSWFPPTHPLTPSICFPLSLFLSPSPSPRPVLPSSQSLFLLEFLSLRLLLLSLFCTFVRWVSKGKSSTAMGIATPLKLWVGRAG